MVEFILSKRYHAFKLVIWHGWFWFSSALTFLHLSHVKSDRVTKKEISLLLVKINLKELIKLIYYFTFFVQLRVRDLEGAVEVEKSEVKEVKYNLEALTKQHRFVS